MNLSQLLESVRLSLLTCGMAVSWDWVLGMLTKVRSVKHEITPTAVYSIHCIPRKFRFSKRKIPFKQKVLYLTVLIHNFLVNLMVLANLVNRDKVSYLRYLFFAFFLSKN